MDELQLAVPYIALALGVLARVFLPYLLVILQSDETVPFDKRKAYGQLVAGAIAFLSLVAVNPDIPGLSWQGSLALGLGSLIGGWGAADMGRTTQKAQAGEFSIPPATVDEAID